MGAFAIASHRASPGSQQVLDPGGKEGSSLPFAVELAVKLVVVPSRCFWPIGKFCVLSHHSKDDEVAGTNEEIHDINYKDRE
ncbi:hypothetical protein TEQG_08155 [Trichophyton equinum CBS 127.97]|uniref:Uncharacterized protein n=1 Tax=Trichophyton equinum (strain ATCC MYA-4606 / CBS 127.97) TaxID=559882 RepID=F2Q4M1_TRIEC|nr:hypothetical protein TEQG_08155 [Trichophyton equinum CBS 127.97]